MTHERRDVSYDVREWEGFRVSQRDMVEHGRRSGQPRCRSPVSCMDCVSHITGDWPVFEMAIEHAVASIV